MSALWCFPRVIKASATLTHDQRGCFIQKQVLWDQKGDIQHAGVQLNCYKDYLCCWCSVRQHWPMSYSNCRGEHWAAKGTWVWATHGSKCLLNTWTRIKEHWFWYMVICDVYDWGHLEAWWWWVTPDMKCVASIHSWTSVTTRLNWDNTIEDLISYIHVVTVQNLNHSDWMIWHLGETEDLSRFLLASLKYFCLSCLLRSWPPAAFILARKSLFFSGFFIDVFVKLESWAES